MKCKSVKGRKKSLQHEVCRALEVNKLWVQGAAKVDWE